MAIKEAERAPSMSMRDLPTRVRDEVLGGLALESARPHAELVRCATALAPGDVVITNFGISVPRTPR
jgi:hypothetical protein